MKWIAAFLVALFSLTTVHLYQANRSLHAQLIQCERIQSELETENAELLVRTLNREASDSNITQANEE